MLIRRYLAKHGLLIHEIRLIQLFSAEWNEDKMQLLLAVWHLLLAEILEKISFASFPKLMLFWFECKKKIKESPKNMACRFAPIFYSKMGGECQSKIQTHIPSLSFSDENYQIFCAEITFMRIWRRTDWHSQQQFLNNMEISKLNFNFFL